MAVVFSEDTEYAKEMRKHEATHTKFGAPGRPYQFREYPKRLYKCERGADGVKFIGFTVNDSIDLRNMQSRGYYESQEDAQAAENKAHTEAGRLAAEREYAIQTRHSAPAIAEIRAAEEHYGARHLPSVPETPIRRPGRPRKSVAE